MLHMRSIECLSDACPLAVSRCFLWHLDTTDLCTACISQVVVTALTVCPEQHRANRET